MKVTIGACDDSTCEVEGKHVHYKDEVHMIADNVDAAEFTQYEGEGIRKMVSVPPAEIPKHNSIDVCFELSKLGFPFSHRDENSLFFLRPDMCIRRKDFEVILGTDGRQFSRWFQDRHDTDSVLSPRLIDEIIFFPTESNLFKELSGILDQITLTNSAGWFAYTNVQPEENAPTIRGQGETPWFALADAWIKVQEWKLGTEKQNAK